MLVSYIALKMRKSLLSVLFPSKELQTISRALAGVKGFGRDVQRPDWSRNIFHMLGSAARLQTLKRHLEMKSATSRIAWVAFLTKTSFFIIPNLPEGASSHYFLICISRESDPCLREQSVPSQKGLLALREVEN